jgi:hypothetical protein
MNKHKNKNKIVDETRRYFLGKLDGFESNEEKKFEKKHLKSYIRGDNFFIDGYKLDEHGNKIPNVYLVKQEWK